METDYIQKLIETYEMEKLERNEMFERSMKELERMKEIRTKASKKENNEVLNCVAVNAIFSYSFSSRSVACAKNECIQFFGLNHGFSLRVENESNSKGYDGYARIYRAGRFIWIKNED